MMKKLTTIAAALTALAIGLVSNAPMAGASAPSGPVVATYKVTPGFYTLATGLNAVWALQGDEYHNGQLYRIDPKSHGMKLVANLSFPVGGMSVAYGSVWVSDYFGNAVWRLNSNGQVQARVDVGYQPQWLHAAFGAMWSSNHHGASLSRIDPTTNSVVATVPAGAPGVFRSGPQGLTDDGTNLYVVSSNQQALQAVDPTTNTTTTFGPIDDVGCGPLAAIAGVVWSVDACSGAFYELSTDGVEKDVVPSAAGAPGGITTRSGELWISDDRTFNPDTFQGSDAVLEQLDPISGEVLRTVPIGGDALDIVSGFGDLWVYDSVASTVRRVQV